MMTEKQFEERMDRASRALGGTPSMAVDVIERLHRTGAAGGEGPAAIRLSIWERISIQTPVRRVAIIALIIALLAAVGVAAEEVVRKVLEGEPQEAHWKEGPSVVISQTAGVGVAMVGTTMVGTIMDVDAPTGTGMGGGYRTLTILQNRELNGLIAQKKYTLLSTAETPEGTERRYRFTFSDGSTKVWLFRLPLEDSKSMEEYNEKEKAYREKRQEAMMKALEAGRYRLINIIPFTVHRCLDLPTGKTITVQRIEMPDGTVEAVTSEVKPAPTTTEVTDTYYITSWQQHLDAIKAGRRRLLSAEAVQDYWYEMTLDDGSKTILGMGGRQPLPEKTQTGGP